LPPKPESTPKTPRHVTIATRHLIEQREKAISIRDKAAVEVEAIDRALDALGLPQE